MSSNQINWNHHLQAQLDQISQLLLETPLSDVVGHNCKVISLADYTLTQHQHQHQHQHQIIEGEEKKVKLWVLLEELKRLLLFLRLDNYLTLAFTLESIVYIFTCFKEIFGFPIKELQQVDKQQILNMLGRKTAFFDQMAAKIDLFRLIETSEDELNADALSKEQISRFLKENKDFQQVSSLYQKLSSTQHDLNTSRKTIQRFLEVARKIHQTLERIEPQDFDQYVGALTNLTKIGASELYDATYHNGESVTVKKLPTGRDSNRVVKRDILALSLLAGCENIPKIKACCDTTTHYFLITEEISKLSLYNWTHDQQPTSHLVLRLRVLLGVANGLALLHRFGIMHKNFKSQSIMFNSWCVNDLSTPVISDFAAIKFSNNSLFSSCYEKSQPFYWRAPETVLGGSGTRFLLASDVYSLGVVIWEVLTGSLPFGGEKDSSLLWAKIKNPSIYPASLEEFFLVSPTITAKVKTLLMACWNFVPEARPTSTAVLRELQLINHLVMLSCI